MKSTFRLSIHPALLALLFGPFISRHDAAAVESPAPPTTIAIVGLVHGHVQGLLDRLLSHPEVTLVGIAEPDSALRQKYVVRTHLPENLFFSSEKAMLDQTHPQALLIYTSVLGHRAAIEEAASRHIAVMVEKPLCTTLDDALAIQSLSEKFHIPVLTNYETTWYASNHAAANLLASRRIGELRKLVIHDGHRGPKEIGVSSEFLDWLTDPHQNGAGALFDFGCYGADLATFLMHGESPLAVTAVTQQIKPDVYPHVDDEGTIILSYAHAQAIIQASWNWPFDRKDMEVYGSSGYVATVRNDRLRIRLPGENDEHFETAPPLVAPQNDSINYLVAVLQNRLQPQHDLTSLDTNVIVMRILDAARRSASTGHTVHLKR